jgi:hypothetical protein
MFDKFSDAAEKLASNLSRRSFLGRLGTCALAVTGLFAFASSASAKGAYRCCGVCGIVNGRPLCTYSCYPGAKCPPGTFRAQGMCGGYC